ncbi:GCN5 family acetyltransferase [Paenibacillus yonginensis]|uniref:GCN5 family acetyltransferase n=1 Tax=Paenibacillus yonginensis TaxID=1462996 RepID=A0A1B1MZ04_9BACL|nr:GNAT family N-acetyltransferase [Paenibacillus yonginensis]ANS74410.1 GCN5 family acetyltransferase [Paenibacillus yonginensis]
MNLKLVPVRAENKDTLINLYQFYEYDFSRYMDTDVDTNGKYALDIDFYWEGDERWNPFLIEVNGAIAGFLIVLFENMDTDPDPTHVIYDFMVLHKYRRTGVGRRAAVEAFNMYQANWSLAQIKNNLPAISFWRNVIEDYTDGNFTERYSPDSGNYIQKFSTKK